MKQELIQLVGKRYKRGQESYSETASDYDEGYRDGCRDVIEDLKRAEERSCKTCAVTLSAEGDDQCDILAAAKSYNEEAAEDSFSCEWWGRD